MEKPTKETIHDLLVRNVPLEVIMGIEEALVVGAQHAYIAARGMDDGHLPSVVGQLRHFHMNELFQRALAAHGAFPSPIRGNSIVTGRTGVFTLARFNVKEGFWVNGRRSQTRRQMSMANKAIEPLVQPELFGEYEPTSDAVVFFVACFAGSLQFRPETPVSIQIAVPDRNMQGWLFREPIDVFAKRYYQEPMSQQNDLAMPKLKRNIGKQDKDGTTQ
ncbi:MAG: alpha/beta hydrolase [Rhodocyclaceae bacterium]|nr:alpha/beta hydrolase [Rhodocyclaceae bacterium]